MATEIAPAAPPTLGAVASQVDAQIKNYVVTHVLGSIAFLAIIAAGLCGWGAIHYANKLIDKADAAEAQYKADKAEWQKQLQSDAQTITQLSTQQQGQTKVIVERDTQAQQQVAQVTQPDKNAQQVAQDSKTVLGADPDITQDGKLAYTTVQVQGIMADKITGDAAKQDYADTLKILDEEKQKNVVLQADLAGQQKLTNKSEEVTKDYAKAAKASRWKTAADWGEKVGIAVGSAWLASKITH